MTTVAFLGLGRMGLPMAANLRKAGFELVVWNRTRAKAVEFASQYDALVADSPAHSAVGADIVVSMLADDEAVLQAHAHAGTFTALRPGAVVVDMSTIGVPTVATLAAEAARHGLAFVDAPVSGSVAAATGGTLTILAGGPAAAVETVRPVLAALGEPVIHLGETGSGASMKLAVNTVVHILNGAISEALVLAERSGIARGTAYEVFCNSAVAAPFVHYRREAFERPDESPVAFRLTLAAKDLRVALGLAEHVGADLPHTTEALRILNDAMAAGYGDHDESAVAEYLRSRSSQPGEEQSE